MTDKTTSGGATPAPLSAALDPLVQMLLNAFNAHIDLRVEKIVTKAIKEHIEKLVDTTDMMAQISDAHEKKKIRDIVESMIDEHVDNEGHCHEREVREIVEEFVANRLSDADIDRKIESALTEFDYEETVKNTLDGMSVTVTFDTD